MFLKQNWLMQVLTPESREVDPVTNPGNPIKDEMMLQMVDGNYELIKVGETNLYEQIQSHKDSTDIYKILQRYAMGDTSVLQQAAGMFMDTIDAPTSLAEAYDQIHNLKEYFNRLPLEIRKEYEHDASAFVADFGTEHFNDVMKEIFSPAEPETVPPVVEKKEEVKE